MSRRTARTAAALTLMGVAGFLAAGSVAGSTQAKSTVSLRSTKLGLILVNAQGRTLYLFAKDRNGRSACSGSCATFWPPLLSRSKPTAGPGVKASLLGRTRRSNGSMQVTYNRHPLYTFALDKQAGQTKGQSSLGFGGRWWAAPREERRDRPASDDDDHDDDHHERHDHDRHDYLRLRLLARRK